MANVDALEHIILGRNSASEEHSDPLRILGMSANLSTRDADLWRGLVSIAPLSIADESGSMSIGMFSGPDGNSILVRTFYRNGVIDDPIYQYILFPQEIMRTMSVNIAMLVEFIGNSIPDTVSDEALSPVVIPSMPTLTIDKRVQLFDELLGGNKELLLHILSAALDERRVCLRGFPQDLKSRLDLVQALLLLLPTRARLEMTFTSNTQDIEKSKSRIVFCENTPVDMARHIIDHDAKMEFEVSDFTPFVRCLGLLWQEDKKTFLDGLRTMELIAEQYMPNSSLLDGINATAERFLLDQQVLDGGKILPETVMDILVHYPPMHGDIRNKYAEQLLEYTLAERDIQAAEIIVDFMDKDTNLGLVLTERLKIYLEGEPDAVYFFVRIRLSKEIDVTWLPILQDAAEASLRVAIDDGDYKILLEWLNLIAREPNGYELDSVLRNAIRIAQERAYEDGELGDILFRFVCKRVPDLIDSLLSDSKFMAVLIPPIGLAIRDYDPESVEQVITIGREIALVLMGRGSKELHEKEAAVAVFSPENTDYLWTLHMDEKLDVLPKHYLPEHILGRLVNDGAQALPEDSLQVLLDHIVETETAAFFASLSKHLSEQIKLSRMLTPALLASGLAAENIIGVVSQASELLSVQERVDIYLRVVEHHGWQIAEIQSLLEQIARLMQQNTDVQVSIDDLGRMLQLAVDADIDMVIRVVVRYMLDYLDTVEDEGVLVSLLIQLNELIKPNTSGHNYMFDWLRDFVHRQPPPRLQQVDKLLNGNRDMAGVRSIFQTSVAIRKTIGNRTLDEFAQVINLTFSVLQAFSDSFDAENKQLTTFDHHTVIAELTARGEELPLHEGRVLAKDLNELIQLIIAMADNRMKSTIIRREGDIERQLRSGEQAPQSAIDTMKWLSSYLSSRSEEE